MRRVGIVDLTLKFANALLYFPPRALVKDTIGGAALFGPVGELQAVDLLAGARQQPDQVVEAFLIAELDGEAVEPDDPRGPLPPEQRCGVRSSRLVCDGLRPSLVGIALQGPWIASHRETRSTITGSRGHTVLHTGECA